jgi:hypothetical protein
MLHQRFSTRGGRVTDGKRNPRKERSLDGHQCSSNPETGRPDITTQFSIAHPCSSPKSHLSGSSDSCFPSLFERQNPTTSLAREVQPGNTGESQNDDADKRC